MYIQGNGIQRDSNSKFKLGIITSSATLINVARQIAEERHYDIQFSSGSLETAISIGVEMEKAGVEVVVSRGGTSHILKENLHIPVLSIPITSFDLLTGIKEAASLGHGILFPIFRKELSGTEIFEELFHVKITQGIFYDSDSLENLVVLARNQGYEVLIGGHKCLGLAKKYGLHGVELQTSKDTLGSIIEDAKNVARSKREEREKAQQYRSIIDTTSDGIIAVDKHGVITIINRTAKNILEIPNTVDVTGKHITYYIPKAQIVEVLQTGRPIFNRLEKIKKDHFVSNHIPIMMDTIIVGGISSFIEVSNVLKAESEVRRSFSKGLIAKYRIEDVIYRSSIMEDVIHKIKKFAESDLTLLITGETGTGKEIIAHSIHNLGPRNKGPFVSINCSALPEQLLESELFGYEEGAFTGARKGGKLGLFEIAHNGTIFLDEIGTTPQSVQARLLRVLQEKEIMKIGGDKVIPIDLRIIAATNKDLGEEIKAGRFREDLFFRINVLNIHIPSLRERIEDVPLLVKEFVKIVARKYKHNLIETPVTCIEKLLRYSWPGNVRQLENFIERLVLLSDSEFSLRVFDELYCQLVEYPKMQEIVSEKSPLSLKKYLHMKNQENETKMIWEAMKDSRFCRTEAARKLGISRTTLWRKVKEKGSCPEGNLS